MQPALGHDQTLGRDLWREPLGGREIDLQRLEIAVVDADQPGLQAQRPLELGAIMHLDEYVHPQRPGEARQLPRPAVLERGHDQEHAVGAERAAFDHLIGLEDEVLAQARQPHGCARRLQIAVRP